MFIIIFSYAFWTNYMHIITEKASINKQKIYNLSHNSIFITCASHNEATNWIKFSQDKYKLRIVGDMYLILCRLERRKRIQPIYIYTLKNYIMCKLLFLLAVENRVVLTRCWNVHFIHTSQCVCGLFSFLKLISSGEGCLRILWVGSSCAFPSRRRPPSPLVFPEYND